MILPRTLIKKKVAPVLSRILFLSPTEFYSTYLKKIASRSSSEIALLQLVFSYFLSHQLRQTVELLDIHSKKPMKFLFILEQIRIQVAKYSEFWSFYVYRVHPHVPSLTTPPPPPHNCVQNKHVKILHRCRVLYLCTVQRVLKTHWDLRRLDWT